jgi:electron transfer flavoprotein beta subunit
MKVLVAVKRVIDYNVKVRVKADHSGVETDHVKMSMNPFDEIALEEAIRLREKGIAKEVVVVSIGVDACQETLRHALALGADRAILIKHEGPLVPLQVAHLLKVIVEKESPTICFLGKQAIDDDCNQTGQMLAALLDWPQATFASKLEIQGSEAMVTREIDEGLQTIAIQLPGVITSDLRLNVPRYATLPNIMKAKSKTITIMDSATLNMDIKSRLKVTSVMPPSERKAGVKINNMSELMDILKSKVKVSV